MAIRRFRRPRPPVAGGSQRSRRAAIASALACAVSLAAGAAVEPAFAAQKGTHTVVIDSVKFEPETITVRRGETIVWVNKDPFPHTVTAKNAFDSREIAAGRSWKYTARKAGEFAYVCTLHPTMKGTLRVE
jgi:plastocyanin